MEPETRQSIRQLITARIEQSCEAIDEQLDALLAQRAAAGSLVSGHTVMASLELIEREVAAFNTNLLDDVAVSAKDQEAFAMIQDALDELLRRQTEVVGKVMEKTGVAYVGDAKRATDLKWRAAGKRLTGQIERHRSGFKEVRPPESLNSTTPLKTKTGNAGGKPLAKHWDAMWADIATQLWNGDLKPRTQADIKVAMFDWLNGQGIDAGDTVVTERARALWQRMQRES